MTCAGAPRGADACPGVGLRIHCKFILCVALVLAPLMLTGGWWYAHHPGYGVISLGHDLEVAAFALAVVAVAVQVFVCRPLRRMVREMDRIAEQEAYDRPLAQANRRDELGVAARAFNRVQSAVLRTLKELRAVNEGLERRVAERTAEIARGHHELGVIRRTAVDAIVGMDAAGKVTEFNPAAETMFRRRREDVLGKSVADLLVAPHLRQAHRDGLTKYLQTGEGPIVGKRMELSAVRADGSVFPIELTVTALHLPGAAPEFTAVVRDTSERRQAEQALRESDERHRVLAEALPQLVWTVGADGRIDYCNRQWLQFSGVDAGAVMADAWATVTHPDDLARATARWGSAWRGGRGYDVECRLRRASDATYRWHAVRMWPVRAPDGRTVKWVGTASDVDDRRQAEDALRRSEQRFRLAAQCASDVVYEWDVRGGRMLWFGDVDKVLGHAPGGFARTLEAWQTAIHPDDRVRVILAMRRHLETREPYDVEYRVARADGGYLDWHDRGTAVCDGGGAPQTFVGVVTDVTARNAAREAQARLAAIVECSQDAIYGESLDGTVVSWNGGAERLFGYAPGEIVGRPAAALAPPDRAAEAADIVRRVTSGERVEHLETVRLARDGRRVDVALGASPLRDIRGNIVGAAVIARDIGARRDSERAVRESEERFRGAFDHAAVGMALVGTDGRWLRVNRSLCEILGYAESELLARTFQDLTHPDDLSEDLALLRSLLAGEARTYQMGKRYFHKDGRVVWALLSVSLVRDEQGVPLYFVSQIQDVTDRKRFEGLERERSALKEAVAAMEQVLGVVAHELRTPLAGLRAMSEYLLDDASRRTAEFDQFLSGIHEEVVRMADTVNDLLEAARLNSGRAKWNWARVRLADVCNEAMESVRPLIDESAVALSVRVSPADAEISGDADAVRRLLVNLLSNARKHTARGSIEVRVDCFTEGGEGRTRLAVRDTGSGIPADILARLGDAFSMNAGVVGENYCSGTGLGIAICKGIAAAHGGDIRVESEVGRGTTVTADLRTDLAEPCEQAGRLVLGGRAPGDDRAAGEGARP